MPALLSMESEPDKGARYRERAAELRAMAALIEGDVVQTVLLNGAQSYEHVAQRQQRKQSVSK